MGKEQEQETAYTSEQRASQARIPAVRGTLQAGGVKPSDLRRPVENRVASVVNQTEQERIAHRQKMKGFAGIENVNGTIVKTQEGTLKSLTARLQREINNPQNLVPEEDRWRSLYREVGTALISFLAFLHDQNASEIERVELLEMMKTFMSWMDNLFHTSTRRNKENTTNGVFHFPEGMEDHKDFLSLEKEIRGILGIGSREENIPNYK